VLFTREDLRSWSAVSPRTAFGRLNNSRLPFGRPSCIRLSPLQGERIACRAGARAGGEVRGSRPTERFAYSSLTLPLSLMKGEATQARAAHAICRNAAHDFA
jgi:hypothetical protein